MKRVLRPFHSDGCSGGMSRLWRFFLSRPPPWEDLCVAHDVHYWYGGPPAWRLCADWDLARGVWRRGYRAWAVAIFVGVRLGGSPWLPFGWRWGYGWTTAPT